uniref:ATP-dependent helicase HrpB n=1 Tax=uncultured bacterium 59 TaxID=698390 RepID=E3T6H4_9BACT|nr:ATP-dependent helicase HrpB [uncultured bacterium 59]
MRRSRAAVVTAAPGAGKTTRVPAALVDDGPVLLLQPRRVAARAIAARIAGERGWTIGDEVGWQIRGEHRFGKNTRLLVATEGVLTARLQHDPLLSDFRTIVLDEFHERSIHADLAIALARQAWRARDDLRIVIMSATIDAAMIAAFLDNCPVVDVPGRMFSIDVAYAPGQPIADAVGELLGATPGHVLCFLPGAFEIRRTIADLERRLSGQPVDVVPLYGSLDAREQDAALRESARRRVIVATNIAETSVTVPGVTAVVDSGLHKVARYDADRGVDSLDVERITQDAADQRAGRAGRVAPGVVRRLWDARDRLRPHREPDIHRVDLASAALDVIAWGGDPRSFEWFDPPREEALSAALTLLARLDLVAAGRLTAAGRQAVRLPLHPRLARMVMAAGGAREIAQACALISERHFLQPRTAATTSDLLSAIDDWRNVPPHVQHAAEEIHHIADRGLRIADSKAADQSSQSAINPPSAMTESAFRRAILSGYPDRVAQRRDPRSPRVRLSSGAGAVIAPESGVVDGEFLVAVDVHAARPPGTAGADPRVGPARRSIPARQKAPADPHEARIRLATRVEREWLVPTGAELVHRFDRESGTVKAFAIDRYDALVLAERPVAVDPTIAAPLLAAAWLERGPRDADRECLRRLRFAGRDVDVAALVHQAATSVRSLDALHVERALPADVIGALDRDAPVTIAVPSGRSVKLEYGDDGSVSASVKLQELFGLAETPRIGPRKEPVLLALLAPNGRPVQVTRDLRSFWDRTYPEVRKELRGRYPKHPWPDDPWNATPTARATKRHG